MSTNPPTVPQPSSHAAAGIDVAKDKLDLALDEQGPVPSFTNDPAGIARLLERLADARPQVIVVESTGGLERPLLEALLEADLPVALVHPGRVRSFARGLGILAKTDRIDARVLLKFGRLAKPRLAERRSKSQAELRDLTACRRQLVATRTQQTNRRGATASKAARQSVDAVLATLDKQITLLDERIRRLIDADDDFKHLDKLLQSVPGVGPHLSATLAADLRELGRTDRQRVSALAGVAPFANESGAFRGKRSIRGGRVDLRGVLYMATLCAIRVNPVIKAFARRLADAGKANKVRIVACMRKLLSLLNAMVRDGLTWDQLAVVKKLATAP